MIEGIEQLERIIFYTAAGYVFTVFTIILSVWWLLGRLGQSCLEEISDKWPHMYMGTWSPSPNSPPFGILGPIALMIALFLSAKGRWRDLYGYLTKFNDLFRRELNQVRKEVKKKSGWDT